MFDSLVVRLLNGALKSEIWAHERLRPHVGAQICVKGGGMEFHLAIDPDVRFVVGDPTRGPDVTLVLPMDAPARILIDRKSLFASIKLSGSVDLAESLAFVFRNLSLDIEAELARFIGDISARRLALHGKAVVGASHHGLTRAMQNLSEYATEEARILISKFDLIFFSHSVDTLRDDLARLEKRIGRL